MENENNLHVRLQKIVKLWLLENYLGRKCFNVFILEDSDRMIDQYNNMLHSMLLQRIFCMENARWLQSSWGLFVLSYGPDLQLKYRRINLKTQLNCSWSEILYLRSTEEATKRPVREVETQKGKAPFEQVQKLRVQRDTKLPNSLPLGVWVSTLCRYPQPRATEMRRRVHVAFGRGNHRFCLPGRLRHHLISEWMLLMLAVPAWEVCSGLWLLENLYSSLWDQQSGLHKEIEVLCSAGFLPLSAWFGGMGGIGACRAGNF